MSNVVTGSPYVRAGYHMRLKREQSQLTLQQVQAETARRFGPENKVRYQQISRIEKGQIEKPPIIDLIRLGAVYGLSPDDIGEMYGLWPRSGVQREMDPRITRAAETVRTLTDEGIREELLAWIDFAVMQAQAKAREKLAGQSAVG